MQEAATCNMSTKYQQFIFYTYLENICFQIDRTFYFLFIYLFIFFEFSCK